jgi:hypothetical protein
LTPFGHPHRSVLHQRFNEAAGHPDRQQPHDNAGREKREMEQKYISHFREKLKELIRLEALEDYIRFTDRDLAFLNELEL